MSNKYKIDFLDNENNELKLLVTNPKTNAQWIINKFEVDETCDSLQIEIEGGSLPKRARSKVQHFFESVVRQFVRNL